ncbi:MAG TPA: hypothetical protein VFU26_14980 [Gaiellaceae bacterium]|nr:hypothetical protein [Gaiellaceae bacterium]
MDPRARYDGLADNFAARNDDVDDPPGGKRAPMKEWVVVPAADAANWAKLAQQALKPRAG